MPFRVIWQVLDLNHRFYKAWKCYTQFIQRIPPTAISVCFYCRLLLDAGTALNKPNAISLSFFPINNRFYTPQLQIHLKWEKKYAQNKPPKFLCLSCLALLDDMDEIMCEDKWTTLPLDAKLRLEVTQDVAKVYMKKLDTKIDHWAW